MPLINSRTPSTPASCTTQAAIVACEELRAAMQAATDTLQHDIRSAEQIIAALQACHTMLETTTTNAMANLRGDLTAALTRLETARAAVRRPMFQALIAEGVSISAIARLWGISRQLAQRITQEGATHD